MPEQPKKENGKFRIELIRPGCINCEACNKLKPEFWELDENDKKTHLINSQKKITPNGIILKEWVYTDDLANHLFIAECCPVKIIHVYNNETNEKLDGFELIDGPKPQKK